MLRRKKHSNLDLIILYNFICFDALCSTYDVTQHEYMADKKFAQEVPKIATLEACKIGLNRPILILFAVNMSERKVLLIKQKKK